LEWLECDASELSKSDFETVLEWPMVISCGAFIQGAWASRHESKKDWEPTIAALRRAYELASRLGMVRYGREAAKALSIVYCEHLDDLPAALQILDEAAEPFGDSPKLREQRINALFQAKDYVGALGAWRGLVDDPEAATSLDAFAFRRAAICACRIERWEEAEKYFVAGASTPRWLRLETTKVGLIADASYVVALGGDPQRAAGMLADLALELPEESYKDGDKHWEGVIRAVSTICASVDALASGGTGDAQAVVFGMASQPGLEFGDPQAHQSARTNHCLAMVGLLAARLGSIPPGYEARLRIQQNSKYWVVRYFSAKARLALAFHQGTTDKFMQLLAFVGRSTNAFQDAMRQSLDTLSVDDGDVESEEMPPFDMGWFTLVAAAAICCDRPSVTAPHWEAAAAAMWGTQDPLTLAIGGISRGLALGEAQARFVVRNGSEAEMGEVIGASLQLLQLGGLLPPRAFAIQRLLASAAACDVTGVLFKDTFGRPVARRFATAWEEFSMSPFLFPSPRNDVTLVKSVLVEVKQGKASIKKLLATAARVIRSEVGDLADRLE
ncbi:MAG TPA: hypothetical protein VGO08_12135, partial [Burkholderiales bacterium]|nr:hypothetical protein [Burkholderiales bacterium]